MCSGTVPVRCGRGTRLPGAGVRPTVASVLALVAGRARRCAMDAMGAASEAIMGLGKTKVLTPLLSAMQADGKHLSGA